MTLPIFPKASLQVGIGKEGTFGVGVSPSYSLPLLNANPDDVHGLLPDTGWRTSPSDTFGHAPGPLSSTISLGGDVHADTIGFPIAGLLGEAAASGSGPVTWTIDQLNSGTLQTPSYTVSTFDPVQPLRWPGSKFTTMTLSSSANGAMSWTASMVGLNGVTASTPSTNYTTVGLMPGWAGTIQLGGQTIGGILSTTMTLSRVVTAKRNVDGSQAPYLYRAGLVSVSGQLSLIFAVDTYRVAFQQGTQTTLDVSYAQGSGATAQQVRYHCSDVVFTNVDRDYQGGGFMVLTIDWKADANTTDVGASGGKSPVKFTLKNQVASGTYA